MDVKGGMRRTGYGQGKRYLLSGAAYMPSTINEMQLEEALGGLGITFSLGGHKTSSTYLRSAFVGRPCLPGFGEFWLYISSSDHEMRMYVHPTYKHVF